MMKKLTIILIIITLIILSFVLFFILKPTELDEKKLSPNNEEGIIMKGQINEYVWIKSFDNYDYANCHNGGYETIVFTPENSSIEFDYRIEFKDIINMEDYKNKTITIKGNKIIEKKEIDLNCDEISQRPAEICEDGDTATFTCKKIINATIVE